MHWRWVDAQLSQELRPDGKRTDYTYDALGRVTEMDNDAANSSLLGQDYQFDYDNDDSAVSCPTAPGCTYRVGRLARVGIEFATGSFWSMYYDYDQEGNLLAERYPDGREVDYTYDSSGRLTGVDVPALAADTLTYTYDGSSGDALDPTEIVQVDHYRSSSFYMNWASNIQRDSLGRMTEIALNHGTSTPTEIAYLPDGRISSAWVYRKFGSFPLTVMHRYYGYSDDGTTTGYDSGASGDPDRTFFYDQANRLVCAASTYGATSCPSGSTLVESYTYDASDNRTASANPNATTTYTMNGNVLEEELGEREYVYGYTLTTGGPRESDAMTQPAVSQYRVYHYDGLGRLSAIELTTDDDEGNTHNHVITILYDHLSRPLAVVDDNNTTGIQQAWQYFWMGSTLLNLVHTPDLSEWDTYDVDTYVPLGPAVMGRLITEFEEGSAGDEYWLYYALGADARPVAGFTFDPSTGNSAEVWRAEYAPFGERISETTSDPRYRPPHLFPGQYELTPSEVGWYDEGYEVSRNALYLNMWRVYDSRVGQYLQPEPMLTEGWHAHSPALSESSLAIQASVPLSPFSYAGAAPTTYSDPDGRNLAEDYLRAVCRLNPTLPICRLLRVPPPKESGICSGEDLSGSDWYDGCICTNCGNYREPPRRSGCNYYCNNHPTSSRWRCNCPSECPDFSSSPLNLINSGCSCWVPWP
ncbi:MAG: RHS repeat domain-containing protein [Sandaracinaceae bacterium]